MAASTEQNLFESVFHGDLVVRGGFGLAAAAYDGRSRTGGRAQVLKER